MRSLPSAVCGVELSCSTDGLLAVEDLLPLGSPLAILLSGTNRKESPQVTRTLFYGYGFPNLGAAEEILVIDG